jgi:hypothetical protein
MRYTFSDINDALDEVSAHSSGGAPFLIAYGITFFITAVLTLFLPRNITALVAMFQGGVALPAAFWLEKRMASRRMAPDNPLRPLSGLMAMSQALGLPLLIVLYALNPGGIPLGLAALGGVHFLPYAWLHRTRIYTAFAFIIALGAFALQIFLGSGAYTVILFFTAAAYWITSPLVYRHANRLIKSAA